MAVGPPSFDGAGYYTLPLPARTPPPRARRWRRNRLRRRGLPSFVSGQHSLHWLPALPLLRQLLRRRGALQDSTREHGEGDATKPEGERVLGGTGQPRKCYQIDGAKDFHDGGGVCSPGRWPRDRRGYADDGWWDWLRDKLREVVLARIGPRRSWRRRPSGWRS